MSYSIGTDRQDLIDAWELRTPSFEARLQTLERLREAHIHVVPTLSPLGPWNDLAASLSQFRSLGAEYITTLFFKDRQGGTTTPKPFLAYLQQNHPEVLNPVWLDQQVAVMKSIFGERRVLIGKPGFESLAAPHRVAHPDE